MATKSHKFAPGYQLNFDVSAFRQCENLSCISNTIR
jgi:hypothetical protein